MSNPKRTIGRKAAKATVKHVGRGTAAKARRRPLRSTTLLAIGGVVGGLAAWLTARAKATKPTSHSGDASAWSASSVDGTPSPAGVAPSPVPSPTATD